MYSCSMYLSHCMQVLEALGAAPVYRPASQGLHDSNCPAGDVVPNAHSSQPSIPEDSFRSRYRPAWQGSQYAYPTSETPSSHFAHSVWPTLEAYLPALHSAQSARFSFPVVLLAVPGGHRMHSVPLVRWVALE